jgi:TolA-binding protein
LARVEEVLGRTYKNQAKFDEARAVFKQVTDDPIAARTETAAKAQFMIAETYLAQKDYKAALENYLKVDILYDFPEWQAPALFQAAACDKELGDWPQVVRDYETLIAKFPKSEYAEMAKPLLVEARKNAKK